MDFLSYRGLPMRVLQTVVHERAPQHDRSHTTYECTRWRVSFLVTYNAGAISYAPGPTLGPGARPPITDNAIRAWLEQPRGRLVVRSGSGANFNDFQLTNPATDPASLVIASPTGTLPCDARNGPFCVVNSVQHIPGESLWKIHLTIETYVNETPAQGRLLANPLVLNNRWTVTTDVNWQHLTTRVYQGICTVNAAQLRNPTVMGDSVGLIDSLRASFAGFSVPLGFQRTHVNVQMTPDGNNAVYVVRDEEQNYNKKGMACVPRVEVQDSNWCWQGSWGRAALQAAQNQANAGMPPIGLSSWELGAWFKNKVMGFVSPVAANLPKYYRNVVVRVWGNRLIQRPALVNLAMAVAFNRMGQTALLDTTTSEIIVTGDTNRLITVAWTCNWGKENSFGDFVNIFAAIGWQFAPALIGGPGGRSWESSIGRDLQVTAGDFNLNTLPTINPPFPNQSGTAGTATGRGIAPMIAQVLEGFQDTPERVP